MIGSPVKLYGRALMAYLAITLPLLFVTKGTVVYWINSLHHPVADQFFKYITFLGDGITLAIIGVIMLLFNYYRAVFTFFCGLLALVITQPLLKRGIFRDMDRPKKYLADFNTLHVVEGVSVHGSHTFPSGHTTTIFVITGLLALWVNDRRLSVPLLLLAVVVAISRIYLLQHFFIDTWFGAVLGSGIVWVATAIGTQTGLGQKPGWQQGLLVK